MLSNKVKLNCNALWYLIEKEKTFHSMLVQTKPVYEAKSKPKTNTKKTLFQKNSE